MRKAYLGCKQRFGYVVYQYFLCDYMLDKMNNFLLFYILVKLPKT